MSSFWSDVMAWRCKVVVDGLETELVDVVRKEKKDQM
jgi:hypothetical protein